MENNLGETKNFLSEVRMILIGWRWSGKSSSGNTILRKERFECGRTRTTQSEVRHEEVEGRRLTVVDVPGWSSSFSLTEIPEGEKQRFKLNVSKCPPGPHVFLLIIPIDTAFSAERKRMVEEQMKLLGERVWRFTMVLFTCGDFLRGKTIEGHIESEGDALRWLVERCNNRYHVINNKNSSSTQVTQLMEKVEEMVFYNDGRYYEMDKQILEIIKEKQQDVAERAEKRQRRAEEQRQHVKTLVADGVKKLTSLRMVLLGSRNVGKTSVGNTILGLKDQEGGKRTVESVSRHGFVGDTEVTLVDTPGWWKGFLEEDTPAVIKEELMRSVFLCPPGPHVFLLVIDADASFNSNHLRAVTSHVELLGQDVWKHTLVVFTRGDWMGRRRIEEYIEGEGEAMQALVEQCGNRYHLIDNKNTDYGSQVEELLEKITETVAGNGWKSFVQEEKMFLDLEEKRQRVEEGARRRRQQVEAQWTDFKGKGSRPSQKELKIVLLGQKLSGKSATGNNLLRKEVLPTYQNRHCQMEENEVDGRKVTVIDSVGWWVDSSRCTEALDREIVRGLSMSPSGVHAVLLVVPLDMTFREAHRSAVEDHMNLFDADIWKHTMVLFTYGDNLADKAVEEHIEREHGALRWLVDMCQNKYHVINNKRKGDMGQVTELFEKIEEMDSGNGGQLYCPEMSDVYMRVEEKFSRRQLKGVLKQRFEEEIRKREVQLMSGFRETLLELQVIAKTRAKSLGISHWKKDGKGETLDAKISLEIEKLNDDITKSSTHLNSSMPFLIPSLEGSVTPSIMSLPPEKKPSSPLEKVLGWLSTLQVGTNLENQLTLNFSQGTSGYRSVLNANFENETTLEEIDFS